MEMPEELRQQIAALPRDFFGSVEISIQNGEPVVIKLIATKKIYRERNNRDDNNPSR